MKFHVRVETNLIVSSPSSSHSTSVSLQVISPSVLFKPLVSSSVLGSTHLDPHLPQPTRPIPILLSKSSAPSFPISSVLASFTNLNSQSSDLQPPLSLLQSIPVPP
ncbi:hypothetical protein JAAARDRAFT_62145 [Jaapia argillacea MUCL 33604]|uniref:Uncharacterized protein n=1 Tax=Jaapia argillacea MUCL 33604 TaxID=933084 RepID=A0A067PLU8_9AGAM|nr:hypothetical protein JAAARDRAFT_62145 [Jaapia argillacea MUCL 33604]